MEKHTNTFSPATLVVETTRKHRQLILHLKILSDENSN